MMRPARRRQLPPGIASAASSLSGSDRSQGGGGRGRQKISYAAAASGAGSPGARAGAARDAMGQAANKPGLTPKKVESTTTALAIGIIEDVLVDADAEQRLLDQPEEVTEEQVRDWIKAGGLQAVLTTKTQDPESVRIAGLIETKCLDEAGTIAPEDLRSRLRLWQKLHSVSLSVSDSGRSSSRVTTDGCRRYPGGVSA